MDESKMRTLRRRAMSPFKRTPLAAITNNIEFLDRANTKWAQVKTERVQSWVQLPAVTVHQDHTVHQDIAASPPTAQAVKKWTDPYWEERAHFQVTQERDEAPPPLDHPAKRTRQGLVRDILKLQVQLSLHPVVVHLAVRVLDRVLVVRGTRSATALPDRRLPLIALAAVWIATKLADQAVKGSTLITFARGFTACELRREERRVLRDLQFSLPLHTPLAMLDFHLAALQVVPCKAIVGRELSVQLLQLSVLDWQLAWQPASLLAAAALTASLLLISEPPTLQAGTSVWETMTQTDASFRSYSNLGQVATRMLRVTKKYHAVIQGDVTPVANLYFSTSNIDRVIKLLKI